MPVTESQLAVGLGLATAGFLAGFWFLPGGVLALRRRARGELQVDVRPGYRPATLYRLFGLYGPEGIASFRRMLLADMIFPAIYGALFFVLADLLAASRPANHAWADLARVTGLAGAVFDYAENTCLFFVLRRLPEQRVALARLAGLSTTLKTLCLFSAVGALVVELGTGYLR